MNSIPWFYFYDEPALGHRIVRLEKDDKDYASFRKLWKEFIEVHTVPTLKDRQFDLIDALSSNGYVIRRVKGLKYDMTDYKNCLLSMIPLIQK